MMARYLLCSNLLKSVLKILGSCMKRQFKIFFSKLYAPNFCWPMYLFFMTSHIGEKSNNKYHVINVLIISIVTKVDLRAGCLVFLLYNTKKPGKKRIVASC